ncbi:MAG: T3SS effector HopA1 family protein, partial [Gemmatimonadota bacterium]|nr:T3SS effector HopA1 family protein [Gemmatimonadota bacterium]
MATEDSLSVATSSVVKQVRAIVEATNIHDLLTFSFQRRTFTAAASTVAIPGTDPSYPVVSLLAQTLYERCYCARYLPSTDADVIAPAIAPGTWDADGWNDDDVSAFQRGLSAANAGGDTWDDGWRVRNVLAGGQVIATKGDWLRTFQAGEYLTAGVPGAGPVPNGALRVFLPRESWLAQPGFYFAFGLTLTDAADDADILRLYWNVRAEGSARLVRVLTSTLNRYAIPFKYKCQVYPQAYRRIDGTVLFIARRYFHVTMDALHDGYATIAHDLEDDVPLFTHRLRPGLSVA